VIIGIQTIDNSKFDRGLVGPRGDLDKKGKGQFLTLPGLELRHLCRVASSESLYRLRYPGSNLRADIKRN
jgi:hypothetical protein